MLNMNKKKRKTLCAIAIIIKQLWLLIKVAI